MVINPFPSKFTRAWSHIYRRLFSSAPTAKSPESNVAWQERQFRYYATPQPWSSPLSHVKGNLTGETWEMRQAYREWALKEPAAKASLLTKCMSVAQLTPQLIPANAKNARDKESARWVDWSVTNSVGGWPGLIMDMLLPALIDGFSVLEKVWGHVEEYTDYHNRWTLTQAASIDTQDIRFRLDLYRQVVGVQSVNGSQAGTELNPKDFLIFTHLKLFENPFGVSDLRAAVRACRLIESAIRLRHILLTNYSGPFLAAKAGDLPSRNALIAVMDDARANGWIVVPTGTELDVLNLATANLDVFRSTIEDYQQEIVRAIQGAYLQLLEGGISDGRGNTQVHNSVAQLFQWWLSVWVCQVINKQLIPDLVTPSYGYQSGLPRVSLEGIDEEFVLKALEKFKRGQELGITLSKEQVSDVGGFESPRDETDKLVPPPPGQGGQPGGDPFGGLFGPGGGGGSGPQPPGGSSPGTNSPFAAAGDGIMAFGDATADQWRQHCVKMFATLPSEGLYVFDEATLEFAEWRNYTNPRSGKSGWISSGGLVRYDDPRKKEEEKKTGRVDAATAISRAIQNPERIAAEDLPTLHKHFATLDHATLKGIARSLGGRLPANKKAAADRILSSIRSGQNQAQQDRNLNRTNVPPASPPPPPAATQNFNPVTIPGVSDHPALTHSTQAAMPIIRALRAELVRPAVDGGPRTQADAEQLVRAARDSLDQIRPPAAPNLAAYNRDAERHLREHAAHSHPNARVRDRAANIVSDAIDDAANESTPAGIGRIVGNANTRLDMLVRENSVGSSSPGTTPPAAPAKVYDRTVKLPPASHPPIGSPKKPARVRQHYATPAQQLGQTSARLFGNKDITDLSHADKAASAVNAIDGAQVRWAERDGEIIAETTGNGYSAVRRIYKADDGKVECYNSSFFMEFKAKRSEPPPMTLDDYENVSGQSGTSILHNQILSLRALGVARIKTNACRSDVRKTAGGGVGNPGDGMNGYYTWPRLGYDGEIGFSQYNRLPPHLKEQVDANQVGSRHNRSIQALFASEDGREWWKKNGDSIGLTFDLEDNSLSQRVHHAYIAEQAAEKAKKKAAGTPAPASPPTSPPPPVPADNRPAPATPAEAAQRIAALPRQLQAETPSRAEIAQHVRGVLGNHSARETLAALGYRQRPASEAAALDRLVQHVAGVIGGVGRADL